MIPLMILVVLAVTLINAFSGNTIEVSTWPFVFPFLAAFLCFNFYRSHKKQKKVLLGYVVTISEDGITREQFNTPPLSISFMEIKEIVKSKKGDFKIQGVDSTDIICIPYFIDNREALEECLQTLAPITINPKIPVYRKYRLLLPILALAMMIWFYIATNKIIVGICGPILVGLLVWLFCEIHRNKNIPRNGKRVRWYILLLITCIIYVTYAKLTDTWTSPL